MLAFDLPGGWTSPNLLLRFLALGNNPWQPLRAGFTHRVTGERVKLAWSPVSNPLIAAFSADFDRRIDAALLDEILAHRAVVTVSIDAGDGDPIARAVTLARAADAVVNAGALAVRCRCSGLAHGADAFQARVAAVEATAGVPSALHEALLEVYVDIPLRPGRPSTVGMQALGLPDVELPRAGDPDLDRERLWGAARDLLRGPVPASRVDNRGHPSAMTNPHGLVPFPVQTPSPL